MTYIILRLLHNLFDLCQVSLSKTAKHWDSFFTHCSKVQHGTRTRHTCDHITAGKPVPVLHPMRIHEWLSW
jgi:hypothetical protein